MLGTCAALNNRRSSRDQNSVPWRVSAPTQSVAWDHSFLSEGFLGVPWCLVSGNHQSQCTPMDVRGNLASGHYVMDSNPKEGRHEHHYYVITISSLYHQYIYIYIYIYICMIIYIYDYIIIYII